MVDFSHCVSLREFHAVKNSNISKITTYIITKHQANVNSLAVKSSQ